MHTKALSRFMQLLDASFPSGAFVHSFGLESHLVLQKVSTIEELENYLHNLIIDQYQNFEFAFIHRLYTSLQEHKLHPLIKNEQTFSAMLNYDHAKASQTIGHNYLKHIKKGAQKEIVQAYYHAIEQKKTQGNELGVLAAYAFDLGLSEKTFTLLWCKKSLINLATSTLKISRIKPSEVQAMLFNFDEQLEHYIKNAKISLENFNPLHEEVIYQHRYLEPKLFMT